MRMLRVGETGRATFMDGLWTPPDAPTAKQAATRAGATESNRVLIGRHARIEGAHYEIVESGDGYVNVYETRAGASTSNEIAAEHDKLRAINAANAVFWARQGGGPARK